MFWGKLRGVFTTSMNRVLGVPSGVYVGAIFPQVFGHHGLGCWLLAPSYFSSLFKNALHFIRTVNKSILRWLPVNMGTDMKEFILESIMVLWEVTKTVLKLDHVSVMGAYIPILSICPFSMSCNENKFPWLGMFDCFLTSFSWTEEWSCEIG